MYFLFSSDEDGEHWIRTFETSEEIEAMLNDWLQDEPEEPAFIPFLDPPLLNMDYWGDNHLLIKGEIVVPVAKETVTRYKV